MITFSAHLWISDSCSQKLRVLQDGELRFRSYTELSYLTVSSGVLHNRASCQRILPKKSPEGQFY